MLTFSWPGSMTEELLLLVRLSCGALVATCVAWLVSRLSMRPHLRRMLHRRQRGFCVACLYPVPEDVARCPECGTEQDFACVRVRLWLNRL